MAGIIQVKIKRAAITCGSWGLQNAVGAAIHGFPMAWTIILSAYLVFLLHY